MFILIVAAIISLVILLILTVVWAFIHYGTFDEIGVKVGNPPVNLNNKLVAYKLERGPYNESGHLFTEITGDLARINPEILSSIPMIGFYYDDQDELEDKSKARYAVGIIIPEEHKSNRAGESSTSKDDTYLEKDVRAELVKGLEDAGFKFVTLPTIDHVVYTKFPFRGYLSIIIATRRVYPALYAYTKEHKLCAHPSLEIYSGDSIYFIQPLSKQDLFYLFPPESESENDSDDEGDEESRTEDYNMSNSEAEHEEEPEEVTKSDSSQESARKSSGANSTSSFEEIDLPPKKNKT